MELVALAALGTVAIYLGTSDWKGRTVDLRLVLACYGLAACVNIAVSLASPDMDVSRKASTITAKMESIGESVLETVRSAAGSILTALFLSVVMIAFWRAGLLAEGDALAIPATLSMLPFVASPVAIVLYFVSAMAFVLLLSVAQNVCNNMRHRDAAYGALWHRLYLLLFCYYGDGKSCRYACRYAFKYSDKMCRDCDGELYYTGSEKAWLVPVFHCFLGLRRLFWHC